MNTNVLRTSLFVMTFAVALIVLMAFSTRHVYAATATWDGGGGDANFSTAANWVGDVAPVSGDDLVFDGSLGDFAAKQPVNDMTAGTSFASITNQNNGTGGLTLTGNDFDLSGDITNSPDHFLTIDNNITLTANASINSNSAGYYVTVNGAINLGSYTLTLGGSNQTSLVGVVSGTGGVAIGAVTAGLGGANTFTGGVTVASGGVLQQSHDDALGAAASTAVFSSGSIWKLRVNASDVTIDNNVSIGGPGFGTKEYESAFQVVSNFGAGGGGLGLPDYGDLTITGVITLTDDMSFYANSYEFTNSVIDLGSVVEGGYTLTLPDGSTDVKVGSMTKESQTAKTTITDDQTYGVVVAPKDVTTVDGTRGDSEIFGTLKGSGTLGDVIVYSGATVAPGASPGCLTTGDLTYNSGSTFEVEIDGSTVCTEYDQTTVNGTVNLGDATLSIVLGSGVSMSGGEELIIISNDGTDAITGTFNGFAEGATVTSGSQSYVISYVGGDGNDATLTAAGTPAAPDTGFEVSANNPELVAAVTLTSTALLVVIGVKASKSKRN